MNDTLTQDIVEAMQSSKFDFRTVGSLAKELGVEAEDVAHRMERLRGIVRRPYGSGDRFPDAYRLVSRGWTRREKLWRLRGILGRTDD